MSTLSLPLHYPISYKAVSWAQVYRLTCHIQALEKIVGPSLLTKSIAITGNHQAVKPETAFGFLSLFRVKLFHKNNSFKLVATTMDLHQRTAPSSIHSQAV